MMAREVAQSGFHTRPLRRRGSVLVMVIAMLGMLFVVGVTFMATVSFETKTTEARSTQTKTANALDAVDDLIRLTIRRGFLGADGIPYNNDPFDYDGDKGAWVWDPVKEKFVYVFGAIMPGGGSENGLDVIEVYGEIPGVSQYIASIEPFHALDAAGVPEFDAMTPPRPKYSFAAVSDIIRATDGSADSSADIDSLIAHCNETDFDTRYDSDNADGDSDPLTGILDPPESPFQVPPPPDPDDYVANFDREWVKRDADGDGIMDSFERSINLWRWSDTDPLVLPNPDTLGRSFRSHLSRIVRNQMAAQLRSPDFQLSEDPNAAYQRYYNPYPDVDEHYTNPTDFKVPEALALSAAEEIETVYLATRIIQNGGLANLNYSHRTIVRAALGETPTEHEAEDELAGLLQDPNSLLLRPFVPQVEEGHLRRRFLIPPRVLPDARLAQTLIDPNNLDDPFYPHLESVLLKPLEIDEDEPGKYRWWPIAPKDDASDYPEWTKWTDWLTPPTAADPDLPYDRRHLVTTISHDDLLLRNGVHRFDANGDPIFIANDVDMPDLWKYPAALYDPMLPPEQQDKRVGRLMFSLSQVGADANGNPTGNYDDFSDPTKTGDLILGPILLQQKRTIYDVFRAMLRNVYFDPSSPLMQGATLQDVQDDYAAQLTANLIDFADSDDVPTFIKSTSSLGTVFAGIERQPYITEIYRHINPGHPEESGIEIYNPYPDDMDLSNFNIHSIGNVYDFPAGQTIGRHDYLVYVNQKTEGTFKVVPPDLRIITPPAGSPEFQTPEGESPGNEIKLAYIPPIDATDQHGASMTGLTFVVDQMKGVPHVGGAGEHWGDRARRKDAIGTTPSEWRFTVAEDTKDSGTNGAGTAYFYFTTSPDDFPPLPLVDIPGYPGYPESLPVAPVELRFANAGTAAASYPTTGTLLLISLHANPSLASGADPATVMRTLDATGLQDQSTHEQLARLDNGRMPIFEFLDFPENPPTPPNKPDGFTPEVHNASEQLDIPWGQLIFDYFTALPLSNEFDPLYRVTNNLDDMTPAVDMGGLRVHGRININAAPWTVLAGLPLMPEEKFNAFKWPPTVPGPERHLYWFARIKTVAGLRPLHATPIGEALARSIVAYREERREKDHLIGTYDSGDYDPVPSDPNDRPDRLRTTSPGFLTVGELANVRFDGDSDDGAGTFLERIDSGVIDMLLNNNDGPDRPGNPDSNFVDAVAVLVALGDWVTTRGHVFTVYGTLRGQGERTQVDERAIRFQQTIDRLPTFFAPHTLPVRVGERTVVQYQEASTD